MRRSDALTVGKTQGAMSQRWLPQERTCAKGRQSQPNIAIHMKHSLFDLAATTDPGSDPELDSLVTCSFHTQYEVPLKG